MKQCNSIENEINSTNICIQMSNCCDTVNPYYLNKCDGGFEWPGYSNKCEYQNDITS